MRRASLLVGERGLRFLHPVVVTKVERQAKMYLWVEVEEQPPSSVVREEREWGQIMPGVGKKIMELPACPSFVAAWPFGCLTRPVLLDLTLL